MQFFVAGTGNREGATFGAGRCRCAIKIGVSGCSVEGLGLPSCFRDVFALMRLPASLFGQQLSRQKC